MSNEVSLGFFFFTIKLLTVSAVVFSIAFVLDYSHSCTCRTDSGFIGKWKFLILICLQQTTTCYESSSLL